MIKSSSVSISQLRLSVPATLGLAMLAMSAITTNAHAAGDVEAGKAASEQCAACHGADGNSSIDMFPRLAGQYESYLAQALKDYRSGVRVNANMSGFAASLTDKEIADLAAYFSSQDGVLRTVEPE